jgi:hypothetical protein
VHLKLQTIDKLAQLKYIFLRTSKIIFTSDCEKYLFVAHNLFSKLFLKHATGRLSHDYLRIAFATNLTDVTPLG